MNPSETRQIRHASHHRLGALFEEAMVALPIAVLMVDEALQVVWLNDAGLQMARRPQESMQGLPVADVLGIDADTLRTFLPAPFPAPADESILSRVDTTAKPYRSLHIRCRILENSDGRRLAMLTVEGMARKEDAAWEREHGPRQFLLEADLHGILHQGAEALAASLGLEAKAFAHRPFHDFMQEASRSVLLQSWNDLKERSVVRNFECALLNAEGRPHPFNMSLFPMQDLNANLKGVLIIVSDLAVQRDLAHALEASEERFGALFRHASDPILILSLAGDILSVNESFETTTGIRSDQLFRGDKQWADFVLTEDLPDLHLAIERCRGAQENESCEYRMIGADGEAVWFEQRFTVLHDEHDQPKGFLAVSHNIHTRKQLEFELRQEAEEMQQRNLRSQILVDRLKGFFAETSALPAELDGFLEGICEILDRMYTPSLILIQTTNGHQTFRSAEGIHPPLDSLGRIIGVPSAMCRHMAETGGPFISNQLRENAVSCDDELTRSLGIQTYFGVPLRDAVGGIRGAVALMDRDSREPDSLDIELITVASLQIAARLRSEEQEEAQRDLEHHLRQSQKMEALGMLAGGVAHDFNNILSGILGFSSHLLQKSEPGSALQHDLRLIELSAERASELTRQLLAFARRKHFPKEPVSLNALVDENLALLRHSLGKNIKIDVHADEELPDVLGDAGQLGQVVMNLCLNAAEAMTGNGGTLTLSTCRSVAPEHLSKLTLSDVEAGRPFLRLQVADSGVGMNEQVKEHIFDPFFTTKSQSEGSGLGLSIVYGIVTNHGGDIIVESREGHGTTFNVYLPVHTGEGVVRSTEPVGDLTGTETILVVDDELIVRQMVTEVLSYSGYTVIALESGDAAVDQYPVLRGRIDLVLLDMVMPGRDGEATFYDLKSLDPDLPILLTSGFAQEDVTDRLLAEGACGLVYKPYKSETLLTYIRACFQSAPEA